MAQKQLKIFFDLDGTLIDASKRHHKVYIDVIAKLGGVPLSRDAYWELKRSKADWETILPNSSVSIDKREQFLQEFISRIESIEYLREDSIFPGAINRIEELKRNNTCYLVSLRRNHENLVAELEWLGLAAHFTKILSGHSESDGSDVKAAIIQQELGGDEGVIIGDTEADILTGRELSMKTIAVCSGIRSEDYLEHLNPDYIVPSIADIGGLI